MLLGPCSNYIFVCPAPSCQKIHGGVTKGGALRKCELCPLQCSLEDLKDVPRYYMLCNSIDCIYEALYEAYGHLKI